jgi:hypothetical protein
MVDSLPIKNTTSVLIPKPQSIADVKPKQKVDFQSTCNKDQINNANNQVDEDNAIKEKPHENQTNSVYDEMDAATLALVQQMQKEKEQTKTKKILKKIKTNTKRIVIIAYRTLIRKK